MGANMFEMSDIHPEDLAGWLRSWSPDSARDCPNLAVDYLRQAAETITDLCVAMTEVGKVVDEPGRDPASKIASIRRIVTATVNYD